MIIDIKIGMVGEFILKACMYLNILDAHRNCHVSYFIMQYR